MRKSHEQFIIKEHFYYTLYLIESCVNQNCSCNTVSQSSFKCFSISCVPEHEIRIEKCSDTCQYKIEFVLTFSKNDQTLVEICTVALHFGSDIC